MKPAAQSVLKALPVYPFFDRCRDWYTLRKGKRTGTFSQHGEDRFVLDYFKGRPPGCYVDVGASHPFRISNTYLLYLNGWRGITVEPMPHLSQKHRQYRPDDRHFNVGAGSHEGAMTLYNLTPGVLTTFDKEVATDHLNNGRAVLSSLLEIRIRTISSLCTEAQVNNIEFLDVDCEGYDLRVLEGINWAVNRPKLVCVETGGIVRPAESDIHKLMSEAGYKVLTGLGYNTFFESI
jgi:FkbM family methyltransferase